MSSNKYRKHAPQKQRGRSQVDGFGLTAVAFLLFLLINLLADGSSQPVNAAAPATGSNPLLAGEDPRDEIIWPYASFVLTQGPHGQSYGHLAVDITAGKGAQIISPMDGEVTALYIDDLGNTTLVLENEQYQVTLLHGIYSVSPGEAVQQGQPIGEESNQGFTVDFQGHLCAGRDCGYHTHLNIYDRQHGMNVNPLEVLPAVP